MTYRPAAPSDDQFIHDLVTQLIVDDLGAGQWSESMRRPLVEMQYRARRGGITASFPDAEEEVLLLDGLPVGWTVLARRREEIWIVEIAVVGNLRGRGIGGARLSALIEEADGAEKRLRLTVVAGNPAERLYERLGFRRTGTDGVRYSMERPVRGAA